LGKQRGRLISESDRIKVLELIEEARKAGARQQAACDVLGITPRALQRWKSGDSLKDRRMTKIAAPHNKLSKDERELILSTSNQPQYASLPPSQIVPLLADQGIYLASESTFYRLLREEKLLCHRHSYNPRNLYKPKALRALAPNQIYSWDITYLKSMVAGRFFYLYLVMDIYSRKIVGWQVYDRECSEYAADVLEASCKEEGVRKGQVILHSDNGSPMKGATMLATLQRLGVVPSFSRPGVSNDNPYSESLFKTLKYTPAYPQKPFVTIQAAREWVGCFVKWYNYEHLHSGIKFVTPTQRHMGLDESILKNRNAVYLAAKSKCPLRWSKNTRNWDKKNEVLLNPERCKNIDHKLKVAV